MIGWSSRFGFNFTTLIWKVLYFSKLLVRIKKIRATFSQPYTRLELARCLEGYTKMRGNSAALLYSTLNMFLYFYMSTPLQNITLRWYLHYLRIQIQVWWFGCTPAAGIFLPMVFLCNKINITMEPFSQMCTNVRSSFLVLRQYDQLTWRRKQY